MKSLLASAFVTVIILGCPNDPDQGLQTAIPEGVGMSSERLTRIDDYIGRHLEARHFAGAVTLVARRGRVVQFKAYGLQDIESGTPMAKESIFRIYSMTKPITSVALMILFEEGRFLLNDPVSQFLPEFKGLEVAVEGIDEATNERVIRTVPAEREVTIRDLLRHTSGLTYGFWGTSLVDKMYLDRGVLTEDTFIQETVAKLGKIPLKHQPGTVWEYSVSTDVVGRLVEVLSGRPFDAFLKERLFTPLGMKDTGFSVPPENTDRLTTVYTPNESATGISPLEPGEARDFTDETRYHSGGGGLVSTAADFFRFAQMLLNGGELDEMRILGPETIELMTQDHLGDIPDRRDPDWGGFGLGFGVSSDRGVSGSILSGGSFGWGGMAHTAFWVDPEEDLIGIFLIQILPEAPMAYRDLFKPVVYQAIVD